MVRSGFQQPYRHRYLRLAQVAASAILVSRVSSVLITALTYDQIYDYFITLHSEVRPISLPCLGADTSSRSNGPGDRSGESFGPPSRYHDIHLLLVRL
jgi:hypothetical protein